MENKEILKKAIQKAEQKGFEMRKWKNENEKKEWWKEWEDKAIMFDSYFVIIFNHDFAKAFWGKGKGASVLLQDIGHQILESDGFQWQFHLQQLVLEENPLKYIEKYL